MWLVAALLGLLLLFVGIFCFASSLLWPREPKVGFQRLPQHV